VAEDPPRGIAQATEGVERMRVRGGQEGPRVVRVAEPAADQDLGKDVRDAERRGQLAGGGEVVAIELDGRTERRREAPRSGTSRPPLASA
jgi:hypothetical protein